LETYFTDDLGSSHWTGCSSHWTGFLPPVQVL